MGIRQLPENILTIRSFRPLIRGFFFYLLSCEFNKAKITDAVSVPSFGDSFFISLLPTRRYRLADIEFPSPHSGILFLWKSLIMHICISVKVSVPSFGDSFFIMFNRKLFDKAIDEGFRPLIRGFFFYRWKES
mgnify:CR=1 FL=1